MIMYYKLFPLLESELFNSAAEFENIYIADIV